MIVTSQLRIAVAAEYKKLADRVERQEKAAFLAGNPPGTRQMVVDDEGTVIGAVAVRKPPAAGARYVIADEDLAMAWAAHEFGSSVIETLTRLTQQGRTSVLEAAKSAFARGEDLPQGVVRIPGPVSSPSVAWTPEKGVDAGALISAMARRGAIDAGSILAVEASK
jgi:hypothetical protein